MSARTCDRVQASTDGRLVADHARVWARGITVTDPAHLRRPGGCGRSSASPASQAPDSDLFRDLADYDRAFGLTTTDGEAAS